MKPQRILSCFLAVIDFGLLLLVHGSNGWTMSHPDVNISASGLWSICLEDGRCQTMKMGQVNMHVIRSFMLIASISSFITIIWSVEWDHIIHCNFSFVPKALCTSIFNFITGSCVLVALIVFDITVNRKSSVEPIKKWGYYLSFVICILCYLTGVLDLMAYKNRLWGTGTSAINVVPEEPFLSEKESRLKAEKSAVLTPQLL
ncbi:uncharacterized protein LOC128333044 [Hemicordylus capensis]|uniref:uncharacterized protein LOC128333044 n=1 Tax=Hemicordylus capensis TaxID=884348 RepID=UPI002303E78F|nr:uncharacterized protein LOC128333044 [Hemicordylus capensis]